SYCSRWRRRDSASRNMDRRSSLLPRPKKPTARVARTTRYISSSTTRAAIIRLQRSALVRRPDSLCGHSIAATTEWAPCQIGQDVSHAFSMRLCYGLQRILALQRGGVAEIGLAEVARANQPAQHLAVARLGQLRHEERRLRLHRRAERLDYLRAY